MQGVADPAPEDRSESDEVLVKVCKCSGKRSEEWKNLEDIGGTGAGILDHGELWHCNHMRKYGSTRTCPFRCTAQCGFRIKYQFKNNRLTGPDGVHVGRAQSRE